MANNCNSSSGGCAKCGNSSGQKKGISTYNLLGILTVLIVIGTFSYTLIYNLQHPTHDGSKQEIKTTRS
jgi:hypothetical protein